MFKKIGIILSFLLSSNFGYSQCVGQQSVVVVSPPAQPCYNPGDIISFCYTMNGYNQAAVNWFHGLEFTFGPGWNPASVNATTLPPPVNSNGIGFWGYYPNGETGTHTGQVYGPGFYFETSAGNAGGVIDGNPGNNFGDDIPAGGGSWTFCFSVQVSNLVPPGTSLSLSLTGIGDGYSGSWTNNTGCNDPAFVIFTGVVCPIPNPPTLSSTHIDNICFGDCMGTATVNVVGNGPFTYVWNTVPNQSSQTIANLCAGAYTCTVTDMNNQSASISVNILQPPSIALTIGQNSVTCNGFCNGSVTTTVSGGTPNYTYLWSDGSALPNLSNVCAGNYTVTITDANGCSLKAFPSVSQPPAFTISEISNDLLCSGDQSGSIIVSANGGTPGYTYQWIPNVGNTPTVNNLSAGNYTVIVHDLMGCSQNITNIAISEPQILFGTIASANPSCFHGSDGAASLNGTHGGTQPYSYQWNPIMSNTSVLANIPSGNYFVTVTDVNGCVFSTSTLVSDPQRIVVSDVVVPISCPGNQDGSISVNITGGSGTFQSACSVNGSAFIPLNSPLLNIDIPGIYIISETDGNNCQVFDTVSIQTLPALSAISIVTNVPCSKIKTGSIIITPTSPFSPFTYNWNGQTSFNNSSLGLGVGNYNVTVTDLKGCKWDSTFTIIDNNSFSINPLPQTSTINAGQSINLSTNSSGSILSNVIWIPNSYLDCFDCIDPIAQPFQSITYEVIGTDINGCQDTGFVHINVIPDYSIFIPNSFTPNGDGNNDFFQVYGKKFLWNFFSVKIFDRWGEKVMDSNDYNFSWNGQYMDKPLNPAVFVYEIQIVFSDGSNKLYTGSITLIR